MIAPEQAGIHPAVSREGPLVGSLSAKGLVALTQKQHLSRHLLNFLQNWLENYLLFHNFLFPTETKSWDIKHQVVKKKGR